jgi:hypothetical protein
MHQISDPRYGSVGGIGNGCWDAPVKIGKSFVDISNLDLKRREFGRIMLVKR